MTNKKSFFSGRTEEDAIPETEASKEFLNFLLDELRDIYSAEKQLAKALPRIQQAANDGEVKDTFSKQLAMTQLHAERLEEIFESLRETPGTKKCEAMTGLIEQTNGTIEETVKGTLLRDTRLLLATQKIKHYEIAAYRGLVELARTMGNEDIISLLEENLSEEINSDQLLTALGEGSRKDSAKPAGIEKERESTEKVVAVYDSINLNRKNTRK